MYSESKVIEEKVNRRDLIVGTADNTEYKLWLDKHEKREYTVKNREQWSLKLKTTNAKSMNLNWVLIWEKHKLWKTFLGTAGET